MEPDLPHQNLEKNSKKITPLKLLTQRRHRALGTFILIIAILHVIVMLCLTWRTWH